jgi:hypothetical protein
MNRQKSSGAEGDRLKEAANINKSLSTLGYDNCSSFVHDSLTGNPLELD